MKSSSVCCSWKTAAEMFASVQIVRGSMGTVFATFLALMDTFHTFGMGNWTPILGHPAHVSLGVDLLLASLHALYFSEGISLLKGIDKDDYNQCKSWLWVMTITILLETLGFAILIMKLGLCPILFLDPVFNFVGAWIIHRYMVRMLMTRANNIHANVLAPETLTLAYIETETATATAVEKPDLPPSYEECTAVAIIAQPEIPSQAAAVSRFE